MAAFEIEGFVQMPKKDDWVVVIVTAIISATRFYVQLPLGSVSPLSLDHRKEDTSGKNQSTLAQNLKVHSLGCSPTPSGNACFLPLLAQVLMTSSLCLRK